MIIGVSFDNKHCLDDYGMYLTNVDLEQPEVRTNYIDVPGRNGLLDFTTALSGEVQYRNRTITLTFESAQGICGKSWNKLLTDVTNDLHGREKQIVFDDDPDWYYTGRCSVSGTPVAGGKYQIIVTCNCDPFKYNSAGEKTL